ncbi:MAG: PfkB family carbohydrate kinase [Alkalilacustris sp.]
MILCAGESLVDLLPEAPAPDGALRWRAVAGGAALNCARALARLGSSAGCAAPVSTDAPGEMLAALMAADGVAAVGGRSDRPTALAVVSHSDRGPVYAFHRHATADRDITLASVRAALAPPVRALCLSGMALSEGADAEAWAGLALEAAERGLFLALDPNVRPAALPPEPAPFRDRIARIAARADLIKMSDEDAAWLGAGRTPEVVAEALLEAGAGLVVLTRGARGAAALGAVSPQKGGWLVRPAAPVPAAAGPSDTVGAGDTFLAAFLDGLALAGALVPGAARGLDAARLTAVLDRAARAAALCCARPGCDPPWRSELD